MLESASKAGFPNVVGMDEAQAAIGAVIVQNAEYFVKSGLLKKGVPVNILMIDMGAGTTDLVLCSYTHGEEPKYEVREVWTKEGGIHFGGSEVDRILKVYFRGLLPEEYADGIMGNKLLNLSAFKAWKEKTLSPALKCGETVDTFTQFDTVAGLTMGEDEMPEYNLNRRIFEQEAAEYLRGFPTLVNECLAHAKAQGEDIDLVLLTGGHSQWYFIREMLTGKMTRFGTIELPKIKAKPERIISVPRPQETVALGLVYSPMVKQIQVSEPEAEKVQKKKEEAVVDLETEKSVQAQELVKEERWETPSNSTLKQQEDTIIELKKSAMHGDRDAIFELGKQWEKIDLKTAKDYYAKAAELGHQQAKEWIERVQEKRVLYIERKYAYGACAAKYSFSLNGTCVAKLKCGEHATIPLDNYKGIILLCIRNELVKRQYREIYLEPTSSKVEITMSMKMSMNMSLIYEDMKWLRLNIKGARAIEKKDASSTCIRE